MADHQDDARKKIGSELLSEDCSLEDVVLAFVSGLSERLSAMESAVRDGDFEALRIAAHQLKRSGGGCGYPVLTERAAALEKEARDQAAGSCLAALDDLKQICGRIVAEPNE